MSNCMFCDKSYPTIVKHLITVENQHGKKYQTYIDDSLYKKIKMIEDESGPIEAIMVHTKDK